MGAQTRSHAIVAGGAGFIGSHLAEQLLADGFRVTVIDDLSSGRTGNLDHVESDDLALIQRDIRKSLPDFDRVDQVYHFASRASPKAFAEHSVHIALTNSVGSRNMFDLGREHDAPVLIASTSEVYGDPEIHPQTEDYWGNVNPRGVRAPYNEGKRFMEGLAVAYRMEYDADIRTVRIFNTYGPRMRPDDGRVVPNFVRQALAGEDLTVHGEGEQTRSFCYVTDLVEGVRRLADLPRSEGAGTVVNLGSTNEITIRELAERIIDIVETDSSLTFVGRPDDDPDIRCPDISRARERLDWTPTTSLADGLGRTVEYFATEGL